MARLTDMPVDALRYREGIAPAMHIKAVPGQLTLVPYPGALIPVESPSQEEIRAHELYWENT